MEWPELLRRYTEALALYTVWADGGCVGPPPALVDPTGVRGPVPPELRACAQDLVAQTATMQAAVARQLSTLRDTTGHPAPVRNRYEQRPMPRYLDAMG